MVTADKSLTAEKHARVSKGPIESGYSIVAPEVVNEVLAADDSWLKVRAKTGEYLQVGAGVVCAWDPRTSSARLHRKDDEVEMLVGDDVLKLPGLSDSCSESVSRFFQ